MKIDLRDALAKGRFRYLAIVETIAEGIGRGTLQPGERLPAQRDLAHQLGIATGTVTRAYAEAERRGLVTGKVGSGTFVARPRARGAGLANETDHSRHIDLTLNRLYSRDGGLPRLAVTLMDHLSEPAVLARLAEYQPTAGCAEHRAAGARWLNRKGVNADRDQVLIVAGLQHGLAVIFTALAAPGDTVATEELNYPGLRLLDRSFHLSFLATAMDDHGLRPDLLDQACRRERVKFLVCTPAVHNPTNISMSADRRREIAEIARRHDLLIVELDEINGLMPAQPIPRLGELAPERSIFVTSTWKISEAGIAVGYVAAPRELVNRLNSALHATTWTVSPLLPEVVSQWINDGTADEISKWHRKEIAARHEIAHHVLGKSTGRLDPLSYNVWLGLPDPWRPEHFVTQASRQNVLICPADSFMVGRGLAPHAVRINLGGVADRKVLETGLRVIADILHEGPRFERIVA